MGKSKNYGFFENYCSLHCAQRPENSPACTQDDRAIASIENVFTEISRYGYPDLKSG